MQLRNGLKYQLHFNEQQKQHFCNMTDEGEKLAREVEASVAKEKEEQAMKHEFLRKSIRDGNKTVSE